MERELGEGGWCSGTLDHAAVVVVRSSGSKSSMQPCACMDEHEWCVQTITSELPARKLWPRSSEVCQASPPSTSEVCSMQEQKGKGRIRALC